MKNSNKTTVLTIVVSLLVAFVLVMSGPEGSIINSNYVYAAKSGGGGGGSDGGGGGGGKGGGSSSDKGGDSSGGTSSHDGGGDPGKSSGGGDSEKSSDGSSSGGSSSEGKAVGAGSSDFAGGSGGSDNGGGTSNKIVDDGFTNKDGPQPSIGGINKPPFKPGCGPVDCVHPPIDHIFCKLHPRACDHDNHNHHDNVRVIHKTVVVHDRNNTPQTILLNTNTQTGTCFVSSQQVVDVPNLVTQLLNQCTSVTITP